MTERRQARSRWAAAAAVLVGLGVGFTPLNAWLSAPFTDAQLRWLAPANPPAGVLVVDIDDHSLAALQPQFGPWPYRRDVHALLVETLRELGARAVAFDLLLVDALPGDDALARTLARTGAPVLLAAAGLSPSGGGRLLPTEAAAPARAAASAGAGRPLPLAHPWPAITLPTRSVWVAPTLPPPLGLVTTPLDADGVLRRLPLWHEAEGRHWPALPLAVHRLLAPDAAAAARPPLDAEGALHLALAPARAAPPTLPVAALLQRAGGPAVPAALRAQVQDRVVFVGSSALLGDRVLTVHGQRPGVQVLAEAYAALRDERWVRPPSARWNAALLAVALLPALWGARRRRLAPRGAAVAAALGLGALLALGGLAVGWAAQPVWMAAPLMALCTGLALAWALHAREQAAMQRRLAHELAVSADAARAKGQFLANVSHEIRTPLNALMGVAELLAESRLDAAQRRQVQIFQEAGLTLQALINDLLDLSKLEAQRLELDLQPFSLHRLLRHLVALQQPLAQRKGVVLRLDIAAAVPDGVRGDRVRIERALSNLLGNALKFTAQGEVGLRVALEPAFADGVRFEIADTGIGIAPSKLESIFEPFSQADASVTRRFGGTGLGLSLTRSVAQLMGGTVAVRSQPGEGSCFTLRLPLPAVAGLDAAPPPVAASWPLPPVAGAEAAALAQPRRHVLLAEDNEVNAYLFSAMLADEAVHIDTAPNGLEALALLRSQTYHIAYIDVQMPGLDGLSLTRELRRWELAQGRAPLPVVSLTANAFASDVQASLEAGSQMHLAKPFSKAALIDSLHRLALPPQQASGTSAAPAAAEAQATAEPRLLQAGVSAGTLAHARVFLQDWPSALARAQAAGDRAQMQELAADLQGVAARLGAQALQAAAQALVDTLASAEAWPDAAQRALPDVQQALVPVMMALREPPA